MKTFLLSPYFLAGLAFAFEPSPPTQERNLVVADGEEIDLNDFRADRAIFADAAAESKMLNRDSPWYGEHYTKLTEGIDGNIQDPTGNA